MTNLDKKSPIKENIDLLNEVDLDYERQRAHKQQLKEKAQREYAEKLAKYPVFIQHLFIFSRKAVHKLNICINKGWKFLRWIDSKF